MKKFLFLLFLFFQFLNANGSFTIIEKTVVGYGPTKKAAVVSAIIEGIQQTQGVKVNSISSMKSLMREYSLEKDGKETSEVFMGDEISKQILTQTKGSLSSYDVLSVDETGTGYEATIIVSLKKFKSVGLNPHNRRKFTILPFEIDRFSYPSKSTSSNYSLYVRDEIQEALINNITQTRKFTVLSRNNLKHYVNEIRLLKSKAANRNELIKVGQLLGTDYMMQGSIKSLNIKKVNDINSITGQVNSYYRITSSLNYKILLMATQQIKWADSLSYTFKLESENNIDATILLQDISNRIAVKITTDLIENIYPLKIVAVSKKQVTLPQGGKNIREGFIYDIYLKGKKLLDPYTKEFIGYEEQKVGSLKIKRVTAKLSYGVLLSGVAKKGMLLRSSDKSEILKKEESAEMSTKVDIKDNNGGVVLPFD